MKFSSYLKDRILEICAYFFFFLLVILLLSVFKVHFSLIVAISILFLFFGLFFFLFPYFRKKTFYQTFSDLLESLDQKYLIGEMIQDPGFLEGNFLVDAILEIDKSMNDHLSSYKYSVQEFKEYIELWVHEVKIPISSCYLVAHNHSSKVSQKMLEEVEKILDFVEQILYYTRSENVEKDYLIRSCSLKTMVRNVIQKNKNRFLYQNIALDVQIGDETVRTDSKWLEFILHQIINNSIQYAKKKEAHLRIWAEQEKKQVLLHLEDNGIGIPQEDLSRVFDKGFTGHNGRGHSTSTGMGLYLSKKLCEKMGHSIQIFSSTGQFTRVTLVFSNTDFYDVLN